METGDLYNAGNSFRRNSSSIWRSGGVEAYSKSSGDEDDEEALKWAALEKLPTFNRLKKGLLTTQEGETSEIDIHHLGLHERKILIDRLLKIPEEDNEKFLLQLRNRIDRYILLLVLSSSLFFFFFFFLKLYSAHKTSILVFIIIIIVIIILVWFTLCLFHWKTFCKDNFSHFSVFSSTKKN